MYASFPAHVKRAALRRQKHRCASCRTHISAIGEAGQATHAYGERVEAHHVVPDRRGGPNTLENCVVICRACHLNAHQGGRWRDVSIYADISWPPTREDIRKITRLYRYYKG